MYTLGTRPWVLNDRIHSCVLIRDDDGGGGGGGGSGD